MTSSLSYTPSNRKAGSKEEAWGEFETHELILPDPPEHRNPAEKALPRWLDSHLLFRRVFVARSVDLGVTRPQDVAEKEEGRRGETRGRRGGKRRDESEQGRQERVDTVS